MSFASRRRVRELSRAGARSVSATGNSAPPPRLIAQPLSAALRVSPPRGRMRDDCFDVDTAARMTERGAYGPQSRTALLAAWREAALATSTMLTLVPEDRELAERS